MKELVVISGKGGTGKTSVAASLFALSKNSVVADCDVDAADLFIVLSPDISERHDFFSGKTAVINENKCTNCSVCEKLCRFDAVSEKNGKHFIAGSECEGCKVCVEFCPEKAIDFIDRNCGQWFVSNTRFGPFVHAELGIGAENSGKLVTVVRKEAERIASEKKSDFVIVDGPPGTGCPVIASVTGSDAVLAVTEPTLSGFHDLERVVVLVKHFGIKMAVVINKWDLNPELTSRIESYAKENSIFTAGKISFSSDITAAQINKKSVVEYKDCKVSSEIRAVWSEMVKFLAEGREND